MKENFALNNGFYQPRVKIIGVGGCGLCVTNLVQKEDLKDIEIYTVQTDKAFLTLSTLEDNNKILIGEQETKGKSTKGLTEKGQKAALESRDKIKQIVEKTDILIIIAGVGGGLGSGVTPEIAKIAKEQGALTIVFAATPANEESEVKKETAQKALQEFVEKDSGIDSVISVSNQKFKIKNYRSNILRDAFNDANIEIVKCIKAITELFAENDIQINFEKFKNLVSNAGYTGIGLSEYNANNPILGTGLKYYPMIKDSFEQTKGFILHITCEENVEFFNLREILEKVSENMKKDVTVLFSLKVGGKKLKFQEMKVTLITV